MKKTVLIPILALPVISLLLVTATFLIPVRESILANLAWKVIPQLISIENAAREGHEGILLKRMKDGKEQFIAGKWKTSYTSQGNLLIVGEFPAGYSSSTGQQMFMVKNDKIFSILLDNVKNPVKSVQESPNQAYLYFQTVDGDKTGSCLMEWGKMRPPECLPFKTENITKGRWEQTQGHELLIQDASGTIYSVDPWENGLQDPKMISSEEDGKRYKQAKNTLADAQTLGDNEIATPKHKYYTRFLHLTFIKDDKGWSIHRIPTKSSIYWLNDGEHMLIKETDRLGIYEPATRTYVEFLVEQGIGDKTINYRNKPNLEL